MNSARIMTGCFGMVIGYIGGCMAFKFYQETVIDPQYLLGSFAGVTPLFPLAFFIAIPSILLFISFYMIYPHLYLPGEKYTTADTSPPTQQEILEEYFKNKKSSV